MKPNPRAPPSAVSRLDHSTVPSGRPSIIHRLETQRRSSHWASPQHVSTAPTNPHPTPHYDPVTNPTAPKFIPQTSALFGGEFQPDGKPDTYKDPKRVYQAVEIEFNKGFSHNWALIANWRIARLNGNYEGAFRNDNNQADPGISSLFDLTEGAFGLLGKQQGIGPLNTDRRQ